MNFEDCKAKIQKISNLIEKSKYPEDILNSKEIDFKNEFQYLCLNSTINSNLVNEVIARLAQNGNRELVEQNIGNISIEMWKDLFYRNTTINDVFIKNYNLIINNTGIMTFREIESFIDDENIINLIYASLPTIIKKLCTYDRAALIAKLATKPQGVEFIKKNISRFFKKGEYDISTTYSKVLVELNNIPEISKLDILEACNPYLSEMLERETAIDNETNDLLDWIYDAMEETKMFNEQRADLQENINNAILDNFEHILDKSNYDKTTIKILKQFSCTREKFENNTNLFIEKSNKLIHMTKIYDLSYEKENKKQEFDKIVTSDENLVRLKDEGGHIKIMMENNKRDSNTIENEKVEEMQGKILNEENVENTQEDIKMINDLADLIKQKKEENAKSEGELIGKLVMNCIQDTDNIINKALNKDVTAELTKKIENNQNPEFSDWKMEMPDETYKKKKDACTNDNAINCADNQSTKKYCISELNDAENIQESEAQNGASEKKALMVTDEDGIGAKLTAFIKNAWKKVKNILSKFKTERLGE